MVENLPASAEDLGSIPGSGRSSGGRSGNPLQYSCLENPTDRGAHGVSKGWTRLSDRACMHAEHLRGRSRKATGSGN